MPLHPPLIDFRDFAQGSPAKRRAIAEQIYQAYREIGLFYCCHLGIDQSLKQQMFAQSQCFFALPEAEKNQVAWSNSASNRGYVGLKRERLNPSTLGDWKEAFNVGQESAQASRLEGVVPQNWHNQWPKGQDTFRTVTLQFYQACAEVVDVLFEALAIALQLPEQFFIDRHQQQDYTLRLLHYPPLTASAEAAQMGAGEHSDYSSLTLLLQDDTGGFEIRTTSGEWLAVPPIPGTILVNAGDLLQRWTNDIFRSVVHRVRLPQTQEPRSRYSIAFFCQPNFDVEIACLDICQSRDRPPRYAPVKAGEYLLNCLNATY